MRSGALGCLPIHPIQAGSTPSTVGMEVCPEIEKAGLTELPLAPLVGQSHGFTGFRRTVEVFIFPLIPFRVSRPKLGRPTLTNG